MSNRRLLAVGLVTLTGLAALFAAACNQPAPAPAGPSADEIRAIVQQEVQNVPQPAAAPAPAPAPAGPSADEIAAMVQQAVAASAPDVPSTADIQGIVMAAVESAMDATSEPAMTAADVESIVQKAVMEAADSQAEPLSAAEVEAIVAAAIDAIPTPEPAMGMMMMEGPTGDPVKIGTLLDYTGGLATYGPPIRNGADLAAELLNDAGGVLGRPVEAAHKDSGTSAQVATDGARALVNTEGVQAIVGSLSSGITIAVANSITIPNEIVMVSPASTSPAISVLEDGDYLFRTAPSDAAQGVVLARLARELGYDSAATLYINNQYGEGLSRVFTESFEAAGGSVTAQVPHEEGQSTYLSELGNATEDSPDVLISMSYPVSAEVYLREAIEGDVIDTFMFVDGTKSQEMFDNLDQASLDGSYGTAPGAEESDAKALFNFLYEERYGQLPSNPFIGEGFDAFAIIALAIEKAGEYDSTAIRDAMREVAGPPGIKVGPEDFDHALELIQSGRDINYEGVSGSHDFDDKGDVVNTIEIWMVDDGQITSTGRFELP